MKSIKLFAASLIFAAMAAVGTAHAAAVGAQTYAVGTEAYTLDHVLSIDAAIVPGYINVVYVAGSGTLLADPSGTLFAKMKMNNPQLVQAAGGQWVNPNVATRIACNGTNTLFYVFGVGTLTIADPGCTMRNQILANSY